MLPTDEVVKDTKFALSASEVVIPLCIASRHLLFEGVCLRGSLNTIKDPGSKTRPERPLALSLHLARA